MRRDLKPAIRACCLLLSCLAASCSEPTFFLGEGPFENERILVVRSPLLVFPSAEITPDDVRERSAAATAVPWQRGELLVTVRQDGQAINARCEAEPDIYGNCWARLPKCVWEQLATSGGNLDGSIEAGAQRWRFATAISAEAVGKMFERLPRGRMIAIVVDPIWVEDGPSHSVEGDVPPDSSKG